MQANITKNIKIMKENNLLPLNIRAQIMAIY